MSADVFQCGDDKGNGCGRMFDGLIVRRIGQLCEYCAEDLPEEDI
jgi:hypothetical protein